MKVHLKEEMRNIFARINLQSCLHLLSALNKYVASTISLLSQINCNTGKVTQHISKRVTRGEMIISTQDMPWAAVPFIRLSRLKWYKRPTKINSLDLDWSRFRTSYFLFWTLEKHSCWQSLEHAGQENALALVIRYNLRLNYKATRSAFCWHLLL